ncbi:MAG: META domain-containing protein [Flavobacteriaceae bacterium]|nr:META domain-containing protein [Flavobacteriaceae bacterium]
MKNIIVLIVTFFFITSCDETKKVIDVAGNVQLSGKYNVTELGTTTSFEKVPYISFFALDKTIKGNTGCNSFFGNYALDLYALTFSDIASTEMACDQPIMDVENAFVAALNNTGSYEIQNGVLTLFSKTDRSILLKATKETNPN